MEKSEFRSAPGAANRNVDQVETPLGSEHAIPDLATWGHVHARALAVGKRIDLRAVGRSRSVAFAPLAFPAGERGLAVLFRYGGVVLFNLQPMEEATFLRSLAPFVGDALERPEEDDVEIATEIAGEERVDASGVVRLRTITIERLLIVADILAKSVVLDFDERRVARVFDRLEPVAEALRAERNKSVPVRQLLDHIGDVLITQHRMVGRVEVTEKPELVWDRPELDQLYVRMQNEYELPERHRALTRKLELISQTATTALGLLQAKRSLRVEWYIVILIVVEIFLTLYDMIIGRAS